MSASIDKAPDYEAVLSKTSTWGPAPRSLSEGATKTLADEAYRRIRDDIIHVRLVPDEKLQPDLLQKRYDIGLSPVREALSRLARDGLVTAKGQRGFFVAGISSGELMDVTDLRIQFSIMALERSIKLSDDEWENRVVTAYYQLSKVEQKRAAEPDRFVDEWEHRNREFHLQLEQGCQSPWLMHFCEILYDQIERYRRIFGAHTEHGPSVDGEHRAIMEAALARKSDIACKLLKEHFTNARQVVLDRMTDSGKLKPIASKARPQKAAGRAAAVAQRSRQRTARPARRAAR